ncbi:hypothetical protein HK096_009709 [Nowakowskiella sp. JEL0078]|nr:hypothetical protein HK096_009709 [Nowakowskiella sp. JEL0078]
MWLRIKVTAFIWERYKATLARLVVPLSVGMLLLGAVMCTLIFTQSDLWINSISTTINNIQLSSFNARTQLGAGLAKSVLMGFLLDVQNLAQYTDTALKINPELTVLRPYPSFFRTVLDTAPPKPRTGLEAFYSSYFNVDITSVNTLGTFNGSQNTTILDNIFRPLKLDKDGLELVYVGFVDHGMRSYPYKYDALTTADYKVAHNCEDPTLPRDIWQRVGYIPACRTWYRDAMNASLGGKVVDNFGPVIIGSPYTSASTKRVTVTASQAIYDGNTMLGVVGVDVRMEKFLSDFSKHCTVLKKGFVFMMNSKGNLVTYDQSRLNGKDLYSTVTNIGSIEFNSNADKTNDFIQLAQKMLTFDGSVEFNFSSSKWRIAASKIQGTDFLVVGLVPSDDVYAASQQLMTNTRMFSNIAAVLVLVLLILCTALAFWISRKFVISVLKPVNEISKALEAITEANLSIELDGNGVSKELSRINKHFRYLLVAIRYGNKAYYDGDLQKALENYLAAEQMMIEFKNDRGHGICRNNIGNVYSQTQRELEAEEAYLFAIANAEALLGLEPDQSKKSGWEIILAERKMNLAIILHAQSKDVEAEVLFIESLSLYRKNDNIEGIAQVSGNYGQMLINRENIEAATIYINEAYECVKSAGPGKAIAQQYAMMNKGRLCIAQKKPKEALSWFLYVLQRFEVVISYVQHTCAQEAINLCMTPEVNKPEIAHRIFAVGRDIFKNLTFPELQDNKLETSGLFNAVMSVSKDLAFVLDTSGSMVGNLIKYCRTSIKKMIDIHTRTGDRLRLETFNDKTTTVFGWTEISDAAKIRMKQKVDTHTECSGSTALWDALLTTAESMGSRSSNSAQWICALTDGQDTKSNSNLEDLIRKLENVKQVGVIIIAVGEVPKFADLKRVCAASRGGGLFIKADENGESVENAFSKAAHHINYMAVQNLNL